MMKRLLRGERGATTVEFAIIAVVLFFFVFGIIEFGLLMYDKHILTNASREGARAGIVMTQGTRLSNNEIENVVQEFARNFMVSFSSTSQDPAVVLEPNNVLARTGNAFGTTELVVTVTYEYNFLFLSGFGLGPIPLTAETRMMME